MDRQATLMKANGKVWFVGINDGRVITRCFQRHGQVAVGIEIGAEKQAVASQEQGQDQA